MVQQQASSPQSQFPTMIGPLDRPDLALSLAVFVGTGVAASVWMYPEGWPLALRVALGAAMGLLSWMFPYLNRVLEG